jgi:hypothetical protein
MKRDFAGQVRQPMRLGGCILPSVGCKIEILSATLSWSPSVAFPNGATCDRIDGEARASANVALERRALIQRLM